MYSSVAFQAGIATLNVYERENVFEHLTAMGARLCNGITSAAKQEGHEDFTMSGPVTCPNILFGNDIKAKRARMFGQHASQLGAIFHPLLNWFICYAHKEKDIDEAINIARAAFKLTPTHLE